MTLARPYPDTITRDEQQLLFRRLMSNTARTESECWLWVGTMTSSGYGRVHFDAKPWPAHRMMYQLLFGAVDPRLQLDHLCRNRRCINPQHLEVVTPRINLLRGATITAAEAARTHCPQGHAYDETNTHHRPSGRRRCRACDREGHRRRYKPQRTA